MADPLSIAASIAGLISLAGTVYSTLTSFLDRVKNAPGFARAIVTEVATMRMTLSAMSDLIGRFANLASDRRAMVQLDCLILSVTYAVMTFSDLESFLSKWPAITRIRYSPLQRLRWSLEEEKALKLISDLRDARAGLSLILNIFQCVSDFAAIEARDTLQETANRILEENQVFYASLMGSLSPMTDAVTLRGSTPSHNIRPPSRATNSALSRRASQVISRPFESILNKSRVYLRVTNNECDVSLNTALIGTHLGSTYTGLTLDRISIISVVALPIPLNSIFNARWYKPKTIIEVGYSQSSDGSPSAPLPRCNITVVGGPATGKSALALRFCRDDFQNGYDPTIEDVYRKTVSVKGLKCELQINDTAGTAEFEQPRNASIREADGFIIVYSVYKAREFELVQGIYDNLRSTNKNAKPIPIALVGMGIDDESSRAVTYLQGQDLAKALGCAFYECSAKDGRNIDDPFLHIAEQFYDAADGAKKPDSGSDEGLKLLGW